MRSYFISVLLIATTLSGCSDADPASTDLGHFNVSEFESAIRTPYEFVLPTADHSVEIVMHGRGSSVGDYAEMKPFDVKSTHGKWQIWVTGAVWMDPPSRFSNFIDRNLAVSSFLGALYQTKEQNNLDVEINFLQIDPISARHGMAHAESTSGMSASPIGDKGCGEFWVDCQDRYVISPFARHTNGKTMSQFDWLAPAFSPLLEEIRKVGPNHRNYIDMELGFGDNNSDYWDWIYPSVFIVDPQGQVMDVFNVKLLVHGPKPRWVIESYIKLAGLDPESVKIPKPRYGEYKSVDGLDGGMSRTKYGSDYIDNAVNGISDAFK